MEGKAADVESDVGPFGEGDDDGEVAGGGAEMEVAIEETEGDEREAVCCCGEGREVVFVEIAEDVEDQLVWQRGERHCCGGQLS